MHVRPSTTMSLIRWLSSEHQVRADLAVLVVSWNVRDLLLQNLEALLKSEGDVSVELIVIDNASQDGTVEAVRARFPQARVIANGRNVGFAVANEQGMRACRSRHVLLLNPDMRVEPDALARTVAFLDAHPDVAVVGAQLCTSDGSIVPHVRHFPNVWSQLAILLKWSKCFPRLLDRYLWRDFDYAREQPVDSVRGSYFAMHERALQELGFLDQRYFIWFEEVDYCKHAVTRGWKVMYAPTIRAVDLVGRSFVQRSTYWKQKQFTRSMGQYFRKWHPWWQWALIALLRPPVLFFAWLFDRV